MQLKSDNKLSAGFVNPIKGWRREQGITLYVAASQLHIGVDALKNWENRLDLPYLENLVRIESIIGDGTVDNLMRWKMALYEKLSAKKKLAKQKRKK